MIRKFEVWRFREASINARETIHEWQSDTIDKCDAVLVVLEQFVLTLLAHDSQVG